MKLNEAMMNTKYEPLKKHIETQVNNILCVSIDVGDVLGTAIEHCQYALSFSASKYCQIEEVYPSPFHSGKYAILLYCLSRELFLRDGNGERAEKIYYLNKILNSVDIYYEVNMPTVWGVEHPIGSVLGRAAYGNKFFFYQGCTVGGSGGAYPHIGDGVVMYSHSKLLGKSHTGNNVIFSANSYVIDQNIPSNCIVFGQGRDIVIKEISMEKYRSIIVEIWK